MVRYESNYRFWKSGGSRIDQYNNIIECK